jgi:hypothetical protein
MTETYDLAFLNGGPAGYQGAVRVAQLGAKVAVVMEPSTPPPRRYPRRCWRWSRPSMVEPFICRQEERDGFGGGNSQITPLSRSLRKKSF